MYLVVILQIITVLLQPLIIFTARSKGPATGFAAENITVQSPEYGHVSDEATTKQPIRRSTIASSVNNPTTADVLFSGSALKSTDNGGRESCKLKKKNLRFKLDITECRTEERRPTKVKQRRRFKVEPESRAAIIKIFSGILITEDEVVVQEEDRRQARKKKKFHPKRSTGTSNNGDMCCPSITFLEKVSENMTNIFGEVRDTVHFPDIGVFQYVLKGACDDPSLQSCSGVCVIETSTVYLLVWKEVIDDDDTIPMTFEPFDIPVFCSCKNISP